jgi:hypothetical protein
MADITVYQQLPHFPRFASIDIGYQSSDTYFQGIINQGVDLSRFDYEIIEGINVVRSKHILRRPAFTYIDANGRRIDEPEEVYGEFYHYKIAVFPSRIFLNGYESLPRDINTVIPEIPYSPENITDWDVFQHYQSINQYQSLVLVESVYPPIPSGFGGGVTDLWIAQQQLAGYTFTEYERWQLGEWDWGTWKYFDISAFSFPGNNPDYSYQGLYQMRTFPTVIRKAVNYISLLSGYSEDPRVILDTPTVIPAISELVTIAYYRENKLESIPGLRSIDWMRYEINTYIGIPIVLPITDCVLGTLNISSASLKAKLINTVFPLINYAAIFYFQEYLDQLFLEWYNLPILPTRSSRFRAITANNDIWHNHSNLTNDVDFDIAHPMFAVDHQRAYDWHIAPQSNNNGIGTLIMDSPRTIEIHTALNASQYLVEAVAIIGNGTTQNPQIPALHKLDWYIRNSASDKITAIWKALGGDKFATNDINSEIDRVTTLGWYIENIARVLGLRFDAEGMIDAEKEQRLYLRQVINDPRYDRNGYSKNSFGRFGRLTPHLSNSHGTKAFDKFADIPQMIEACFEHVNRAIGIQQGTEIKVLNSTTGKTDYYPNQLAMLLDIHAKITEMQLNSKQSFNLLFILVHEFRELWSGIGIPMVYRRLWNRYGDLPSIGHQSDKGSLLTHITTLKINLGILVGNLIARPRDKRNPLEKVFLKKKEKDADIN